MKEFLFTKTELLFLAEFAQSSLIESDLSTEANLIFAFLHN